MEKTRQCELANGHYRAVLWVPIGVAREGSMWGEWRVLKAYTHTTRIEDGERVHYVGDGQ